MSKPPSIQETHFLVYIAPNYVLLVVKGHIVQSMCGYQRCSSRPHLVSCRTARMGCPSNVLRARWKRTYQDEVYGCVPPMFCGILTELPRGSKYPILRDSDPNYHTLSGTRVLKYWVLGPSGLHNYTSP